MATTVKGLHVKVDGGVELVEVASGDLKPVQDLIGGWIEITFGHRWLVMYDEDGTAKGLAPNGNALLLMVALGAPRPYVGDVVFFGSRGRQTANVPLHIIDKAKELGILDSDEFADYAG